MDKLLQRLKQLEGVGYVSISTTNALSGWDCMISITTWGDEYNYYASGDTPEAALNASIVEAEAAQVQRAEWDNPQ